MSDYNTLLEDKRWRNKRKRIIFRDGNKCTVCGSKYDLCVHHTYYYKQKVEPWRYPDESLLTLCCECHNKWHREKENMFIDKPTPGKKKHKKKIKIKHKTKRQFRGHNSKPSLLSLQAQRLGYVNDGFGHWTLEKN